MSLVVTSAAITNKVIELTNSVPLFTRTFTKTVSIYFRLSRDREGSQFYAFRSFLQRTFIRFCYAYTTDVSGNEYINHSDCFSELHLETRENKMVDCLVNTKVMRFVKELYCHVAFNR